MRPYDFDSPADGQTGGSRRRAFAVILFFLLISAAGITAFRSVPVPPDLETLESPDSLFVAQSTLADTLEADTLEADTLSVGPDPEWTEINGRIRKRESFWDALRREGVDRTQVFELVRALRRGVPKAEFNPNIVQKGDRYGLGLDSLGVILSFEYFKRGVVETRYLAERVEGVLKARREQVPLETEVVVVSGEIQNMLWTALQKSGENPAALSVKLTDIFEFYVDFMVDCRVGDRFAIAVEKKLKDGEFVRYGDILTAEYRTARKSYSAFQFETTDGDVAYYDADGKSLRGLFLKSPLNYRRISSGYANRRFHPILKKHIPHHGIDYAAASGTPVWATAAGTVTFVGRKGPLGKYVEVRHKNGYKTGYGHLSSIRRGLRPGAYVKQKKTIGYVGSTGRATGSHLHYNFFTTTNGRGYHPINPSRVVNHPTGKPVPETEQRDFSDRRDVLWAILGRDNGSVVTALLEQSTELELLGHPTATLSID